MKRFLGILLLSLYLVSLSGLFIQVFCCNIPVTHFSGQHMADHSMNCCTEGMGQDQEHPTPGEGDCNNMSLELNIVGEQLFENNHLASLQIIYTPLFHFQEELSISTLKKTDKKTTYFLTPPRVFQQVPFYKLYQRFTYYS